jgi:ketosteroid isomerase-like protein
MIDKTAVARRLVNAFANADLDGVLREVTDDFAMEMPAAPRGAKRLITGRSEIATLIGHVTTTWKGVRLTRLEVHPLADDPTRLMAEYALEGTNLDDGTYRNEYVTVITFDGDKVRRFVEYFDRSPRPWTHCAPTWTSATSPDLATTAAIRLFSEGILSNVDGREALARGSGL